MPRLLLLLVILAVFPAPPEARDRPQTAEAALRAFRAVADQPEVERWRAARELGAVDPLQRALPAAANFRLRDAMGEHVQAR